MKTAKSEQPIKFFWPDAHLDDFGVDDIHVGGEEVFFRNGKPFAGSWPGTLRVTPNHPLFIDGEVKRADAFHAGSKILVPGGRRQTPASFGPSVLDLEVRSAAVSDVELVPGGGESTYDLQVDGPGTYFAVGILVRQKRKEIP